MNIPVKQFIYGKIVGEPLPAYKIVARSNGLDTETINKIYKEFLDCRPTQLSFSEYPGSYALRHLPNGTVAMVRFSKSAEKEVGSNYFLQEHYVTIEKNLAKSFGSNIALVLEKIPEPIAYHGNEPSLPDFMEISHRSPTFHDLLALAESDNKAQQAFQTSIMSALHYLLSYKRVLIVLPQRDSSAQLWAWLSAFIRLLPKSGFDELELFIGQTAPTTWRPNLCIVKNQAVTKDFVVLDIEKGEEKLEGKDLYKVGTYSDLLVKSFRYAKSELAKEIQNIVNNQTDPVGSNLKRLTLDEQLGSLAMPSVGLELLRIALKNGDFEVADVIWFWRNGSEYLESSDIKNMLPIMQSGVHVWTSEDFQILADLLSRFYDEIKDSLLKITTNAGEKAALDFVQKWCSTSDRLSVDAGRIAGEMLKSLPYSEPSDSLQVLLLLLEKASYPETLASYIRLLKICAEQPQFFLPDSWSALVSILPNLTSYEDIAEARELLGLISQEEFDAPIKILGHLIDVETPGLRQTVSDLFKIVPRERIQQIASILMVLAIKRKNESVFAYLTIELTQNKVSPLDNTAIFDEKNLRTLGNTWILGRTNYQFAGSFIVFLHLLGYFKSETELFEKILLKQFSKNENLDENLKNLELFLWCFRETGHLYPTFYIRLKQASIVLAKDVNLANTKLVIANQVLNHIKVSRLDTIKLQIRTKSFASTLKALGNPVRDKIIKGICDLPHNPLAALEDHELPEKMRHFFKDVKTSPALAILLLRYLLDNHRFFFS